MSKPVLTLDGSKMTDLSAFYNEVSRSLIPGARWGRNKDALSDILRGGFGTPDGGFILRWLNADESRKLLGQTLFDELVEIIRIHGPGGAEHEDGVDLDLA